jgi:hypothetical protein
MEKKLATHLGIAPGPLDPLHRLCACLGSTTAAVGPAPLMFALVVVTSLLADAQARDLQLVLSDMPLASDPPAALLPTLNFGAGGLGLAGGGLAAALGQPLLAATLFGTGASMTAAAILSIVQDETVAAWRLQHVLSGAGVLAVAPLPFALRALSDGSVAIPWPYAAALSTKLVAASVVVTTFAFDADFEVPHLIRRDLDASDMGKEAALRATLRMEKFREHQRRRMRFGAAASLLGAAGMTWSFLDARQSGHAAAMWMSLGLGVVDLGLGVWGLLAEPLGFADFDNYLQRWNAAVLPMRDGATVQVGLVL